jgi:hypothetical protein
MAYQNSYASGSSSRQADLQAVFADSVQADFDASVAQQASIYTPEASRSTAHIRTTFKGRGHTTVVRQGGGEVWEDPTLLEWDPSHFRLFVGDLGKEVNDDILTKSFCQYKSFVKAKVIRNKEDNKSKGYGFVSYSDPEDFLKAWKDLNGALSHRLCSSAQCRADARTGKYVGSRPVKIEKATTKVGAVTIGDKKAKELERRLKTSAKKGINKPGSIMPGQSRSTKVRRRRSPGLSCTPI